MEEAIASQEEEYCERTKAALTLCSKQFEIWRGSALITEDLLANYVRCYLKGSKNVSTNMGTCEVVSHKASSTRTMFSHLRKYLKDHVHYVISDACRDSIYRYIICKGRKQPVKQAKIFGVRDIERLFQETPVTMPQIRDKIIFAFGVCTLARSAELSSLKVQDLNILDDGINVRIHRSKAAESRAFQVIWVNNMFFGWDLMDNLKKYLSFIPSKGPLWRAVPPFPKQVCDCKALARSTIDAVAMKMARVLDLPEVSLYHSHSLRRTGATLMAIGGRTEEQIKVMGNWTSSSAASRYIDTSEVCMQRNGRAVAMPQYIFSSVAKADSPSADLVPVTAAAPVAVPAAAAAAAAPVTLDLPSSAAGNVRVECDDDSELVKHAPQRKKMEFGGIVFSGCVQQVIFLPEGCTAKDLLHH